MRPISVDSGVSSILSSWPIPRGWLPRLGYTSASTFASSSALTPGCCPQALVAEQHPIEEGGQWFGIGGEHRSTTEDDRIAIAARVAPQGDGLAFEQIQQHRAIQLPAEGEAEQLGIPVRRVALVGEQAAHIHIRPLGQRGPHHLIAQAGDAY